MEQPSKRMRPDTDVKTYLLTKNGALDEHDRIRFVEKEHHYHAYNRYLNMWVSSLDGGTSLLPIVSVTKLLERYFPSHFNLVEIAQKILSSEENTYRIHNDPTYKYYRLDTIEKIQKKWDEGKELGTAMHAVFEYLSNVLEYERDNDINEHQLREVYKDVPEIQYFKEYCDRMGITSGDRVFYRSEILLYHDELNICGTADTILFDKRTGGYIITDFKRVNGGLVSDPVHPKKSIEDLAPSAKGVELPAFRNLRNHSTNKYGCQLTLYKMIFEHMYPNKRIIGLYLIVIDSSKISKKDALKIVEVPLNKYDECIHQLYSQRALDILVPNNETLPQPLLVKLDEIYESRKNMN